LDADPAVAIGDDVADAGGRRLIVLPEYRRQRIREILAERGCSSVSELAHTLGVSEMTVRRDLDRLASCHAIRRTHGGAVAGDQAGARWPHELIVDEHTRRRFESLAAEHIEDGSILMWRAIHALVGDADIRVVTTHHAACRSPAQHRSGAPPDA
jgi:DeoR/GlpR family transcriptional regulator of sugar metabolism